MGQLLLPIFPEKTVMITPLLGVFKREKSVFYLLSGVPIYSHEEYEIKRFRYITSHLLIQGLCKNADVERVFNVSAVSVKRYKRMLSEEGESAFFSEEKRHGTSHKLTPDVLERIQLELDKGRSNYSIAKEEGISEGSIRYALSIGRLKKKVESIQKTAETKSRSERTIEDVGEAEKLGIATTRKDDRILATTGLQQSAKSYFEANESVLNGGVLFALPALLSQGLSRAFKIFSALPNGYYGLEHILTLLCFMALCRVKSPEELKKHPPGEWGKLMGLDRIPEVGYLRKKIAQIINQGKVGELQNALFESWVSNLPELFFYIDGHVRVYHGSNANLPKRFVSREKLCLNGTTEFWVNSQDGQPLMVITGELNERLKVAIELAIDEIKKGMSIKDSSEGNPIFTLIFSDRSDCEAATESIQF